MKFETELEKEAFKFICRYALEGMSSAGCNDLNKKSTELFKEETISRTDTDGTIIYDKIKYDFDILQWLKEKVFEDEK